MGTWRIFCILLTTKPRRSNIFLYTKTKLPKNHDTLTTYASAQKRSLLPRNTCCISGRCSETWSQGRAKLVRFYVVFLSEIPLNFQDDVFTDVTLTATNVFSSSFRSIHCNIWRWVTVSIFKQMKSSWLRCVWWLTPSCAVLLAQTRHSTYVLNMELCKAYFSTELGISIIPAGEGCKWCINCRLDGNR